MMIDTPEVRKAEERRFNELDEKYTRLRVSHAELLAAAKEVITLTLWDEDRFDLNAAHAFAALEAAITKAEEQMP